MELAVIGLGKLGLPLAALQAQHHRVYGVDLNQSAVDQINRGVPTVREPGLDELLQEVVKSGNLTAHTSFDVVKGTDASLVIVPSPSLDDGSFTSEYVIDAVEKIGEAIRGQDKRHVVVVCSTVMPGECDGPIREALEKASGKVVGEDVGLIYSPEFIALGSVIRDMQNPPMILIGESDAESGVFYQELAYSVTPNYWPVVKRMSLTSAELTKIGINSYVTMKISFANVISELAEKLPGANASDITMAMGLDPRIGDKYIKPGGPFGGPCFPRDNRAFAKVGEQVDIAMPLALATDKINQRQVYRAVDRASDSGRPKVGIVGLSYKIGTPVTEEAFGMNLVRLFQTRGVAMTVFDPGLRERPADLPSHVQWSYHAGECFGDDMFTILTLPYPEIPSHLHTWFSQEHKRHSVVLDVWDYLPPGPWDDTHIIRMGIGDVA